MRLLAAVLFASFAYGQAIKIAGPVKFAGAAGGVSTSAAKFGTLSTTFASFHIDTQFPGLPCVHTNGSYAAQVTPSCLTGDYPSVGYQGGDYVNGYVLWYPWAISGANQNAFPLNNGVLVWYKPGGVAGGFPTPFANPANWGWHDMNADVAGCPNVNSFTTPCPGGYNSAILVGNVVYLVPGTQSTNPLFARFTVGGGGPTGYSYLGGHSVNASLAGLAMGWWDNVNNGGKYIYYASTAEGYIWMRHDITSDGSGISGSGWTSVDVKNTCAIPGNSLGAAWDGHKYGFGFPSTNAGAAQADDELVTIDGSLSTFTCASFSYMHLATIGTPGKPAYTGNGSPSLLRGVATGAVGVQGDTTNGTAWLYIAPWETYKSSFSGPQTLGFVTTRVPIGYYVSGVYHADGDSGGPPLISSSSATWETFDLSTLTSNPQFATNGWNVAPGATIPGSGSLAGQPTISGFQGAYWNATTKRVVYSPSDGYFVVQFDPAVPMASITGIELGPIDTTHQGPNNYLGGYIAAGTGASKLYPSGAIPNPAKRYMTEISGL